MITHNVNIFLDRSRVGAREDCPYRRHLEYHINGTGLVRRAHRAPLLEGSAVHEGLGALLLGADEDTAVRTAVDNYMKEVNARGVEPEDDTPAGFFIQEQTALAEGLVRVAARQIIPEVLANYDIVDVEKEFTVPFGEGYVVDPYNHEIQYHVMLHWMSRADWIGRNKQTGLLEIGNWKTAKQLDTREERRISRDNQTNGEMFAASKIKGEPILGVHYIYLIKGIRRKDPGKGFYVTYNHLIRAWQKAADVGGTQFAWRWEVKDPWGESVKRLGRDWKGFSVFETQGGVKAWVDLLDKDGAYPSVVNDGYQGLGALRELWSWPELVSRTQEQLDRWQYQTVRDELEWFKNNLQADYWHSRHTNRCDYPSECVYARHCHSGQSMDDEEFWMPRVPNHPQEAKSGRFTVIEGGMRKGAR